MIRLRGHSPHKARRTECGDGRPHGSVYRPRAGDAIEGSSFTVAVRQFRAARGGSSPVQFQKGSKDPSLYAVVLEDGAALLGLVFAFLGIFLGHLLNNPHLDGIASIAIGLLLMSVAAFLIRRTMGLLVGEGVSREELADIRRRVGGPRGGAGRGHTHHVHGPPRPAGEHGRVLHRRDNGRADAPGHSPHRGGPQRALTPRRTGCTSRRVAAGWGAEDSPTCRIAAGRDK